MEAARPLPITTVELAGRARAIRPLEVHTERSVAALTTTGATEAAVLALAAWALSGAAAAVTFRQWVFLELAVIYGPRE